MSQEATVRCTGRQHVQQEQALMAVRVHQMKPFYLRVT